MYGVDASGVEENALRGGSLATINVRLLLISMCSSITTRICILQCQCCALLTADPILVDWHFRRSCLGRAGLDIRWLAPV